MRNAVLFVLAGVVCVLWFSLHSQSAAIKILQRNLNDTQKKVASSEFQTPTAEQAYRLEDDCVKRGQSILDQNVIGSALAQDQVSKYNATTNRCYVLLHVHAADLGQWDKHENASYFEDGMTGEVLAWYTIEADKRKTFYGFDCSDFYCVSSKAADCMAGKQCAPE